MSRTSELSSILWQASVQLRAFVEPHNYADYIFRLLLIKLLSDCAEHGFPPGTPAIKVPPVAHWSALKVHPNALSSMLDHVCESLEVANPTLRGVLTSVKFDTIALGDLWNRGEILSQLVGTISQLPDLSVDIVTTRDLGKACTEFLRRATEGSGKHGGEYHTPPSILKVLIEILDPRPGLSICDPVCGVGSSLAECAWTAEHAVSTRIAGKKKLVLHGQEKNMSTWALCRMNLMLHGYFDARIELGDVLLAPQLVVDRSLIKYDRVIADPPLAQSNWGAEIAFKDPYRRFIPTPPRHIADFAFVQHCLAILKDGGLAAITSTRGVLFRAGSEAAIRRKLLEQDCVDAVIALPSNSRYDTAIAPIVLVLRIDRPESRRHRVLFVDASDLGGSKGRQRVLGLDDVARISEAFHGFNDVMGFSRVALMDEIAQNDWNLNVGMYVRREELVKKRSVEEQQDEIAHAEKARDHAAQTVDRMIEVLRQEVKSERN